MFPSGKMTGHGLATNSRRQAFLTIWSGCWLTHSPQPESAIRAANAARASNEERVSRGKAGRESLVCGSLRLRGASPAAVRSVSGRAAYQCIHPARNTRTGSRSQAQVCHFSAVALNACSGHGASASGESISPEP